MPPNRLAQFDHHRRDNHVVMSNFFQVLGEIRFGKGLDAIVGVLVTGTHALQPKGINHTLGDLGTVSVAPKNGPAARSLYSWERSVREPRRILSNSSIGKPPDWWFFSINGGTAEISARLLPDVLYHVGRYSG